MWCHGIPCIYREEKIDILWLIVHWDLEASCFVYIFLRRGFVFVYEVCFAVAAEPDCEFADFFAQARDGLLVHVCLGQEFGEGDWEMVRMDEGRE